MENRTRMLILGMMVLIGIVQINMIHAQDNNSNYSVEVEQDVLSVLDSSEWVSVIVKLHVKDDKIRDLVISGLSTSDFRLKEKLLGKDGFAGDITKGGFDKLINNPNVRAIYLDRIVQPHPENETEDGKEEISVSKEKIKKINLWLIIMPILVVLLVAIYLIFHKKKS